MSIHTPSLIDVLCGKDKTYELHPGNQRYREMITSYALHYSTTHVKQDKMNMTAEIVSKLAETGSRFLKRIEGGWETISTSSARDKTSHALRFCAAQMESLKEGAPLQSPFKATGHRRFSPSKKTKRGLKRKVSFEELNKKSEVITPEAAKSKRLHTIGLYDGRNSEVNATSPKNLMIPEFPVTSSSLSALHVIRSGDDQIIDPHPLDFELEFDFFPEYALQHFDDTI